MPFTPYKSNLDPETLRAAQEAFDMGWAEIQKVPGGYDLDLARNLLAKKIMECALEHGERDPELMKSCALEWFNP